jgi:hypothetical protein
MFVLSMLGYYQYEDGIVSRDSSVGVESRYGLYGPGIESRWWGEIFRNGPNRTRDPPSLLYSRYRIVLGVKAAGAWRSPLTTI